MWNDYNDQEWMNEANCISLPEEKYDIFFPPRDKALYKTIADEAKEQCFGGKGRPACPVRETCLWMAIDTDELHGIFGGLSHRERNALVRKWQRNFKGKVTLKEYVYGLREKE